MNLAARINEQAKAVNLNPSEPQKEYGNYKKGHVKVHGLDISIENPRGSWRSGVADGKAWKSRLPNHYGYIRQTEGGDGQHVDVYLGPHLKSPHVFVIDQHHLKGDNPFDEHKCFIGFGSKVQASEAYHRAFSDGRGKDRIGHIETMTVDGFKDWLRDGDTTSPIKRRAEGGRVGDDYNTVLSPADEQAFQGWKAQNAPNDSGTDYDLRGAYLANMQRSPDNGHMGDTFKKPNHPTFSDQSRYATGDQRDRAGFWIGPEGPDQTFVPPIATKAEGGGVHMAEGGVPAFDETRGADSVPAFDATRGPDAPSSTESSGIAAYLPKAITDIPHEIYQAGSGAISAPGKAWEAIQARHAEQAKKDAGPDGSFFDPSAAMGTLKDVADTGKAVVSAASLPVAPVIGTARSAIGHPMAQAEHIVGSIINPEVAAKDDPQKMYETAKGDVDLAMSSLAARKPALSPATPIPPKNIPTPSTKELFKAAENNYANMHGYGVEVHPQVVSDVADNIFTELHTQGYRDYLAPKTFRAVEELKNPLGQNAATQDIEGVRRALNKAAADPAERDAARRAIAEIDSAMAGLQPNHVVVNPHFADRVAKEAVEARGNYAAAKRSEMLDEINKKAERQANSAGSGTGIDNATRQRIKAALDNPKRMRGFSDAEKEQMEQIVKGTFTGNTARLLGKFSPSGIVSGALSAGAGFAAHGPLGAVALPAAGYVAKKIGDASTAAQAAKLSRLVRSRSPLGKQATINAAMQHALAQPTNRALLPAAGVAGANMQLPTFNMRSLGVQGPVPSYADQKQQ